MGKIAFAQPFIGEFGWEIITWAPYLRKLSNDYMHMIVSSFPGMEALYTGFHCPVEFVPHRHPGRALDWRDISTVDYDKPDLSAYTAPVDIIEPLKSYRLQGEYIRYGTPKKDKRFNILFHARNIQKARGKNWPASKWQMLADQFFNTASIGTKDDMHIPGTEDMRGIPLQALMDLIAGAQVVVGQSSGVMHLASMCGTRHVVWADQKTYFWETLDKRYKETWNPLGTEVDWIDTENWNPSPKEVAAAINRADEIPRPGKEFMENMKAALEGDHYLLAVGYPKDSKVYVTWEQKAFEGDVMNALRTIMDDWQKHERGNIAKGAGDTGWQ